MRTKVSMRLDSELLEAIQGKAAEADRSLAYVTELALRGWLARQEGSAPTGVVQKARRRPRPGPPVSGSSPPPSDRGGMPEGGGSTPASAKTVECPKSPSGKHERTQYGICAHCSARR